MNNLSSSPVKTDSLSQGTLEQAEMFSPTKPFQTKNASDIAARSPRPTKTATVTPANPSFKRIPHGLKQTNVVKSTGRRYSLSPQKSNSVIPHSIRRTPLTAIKQQPSRMARFDTLKKAKANLTGRLMKQKENDFTSSPTREDATVKLSMEKEREEKEEAEKHRNKASTKNTPSTQTLRSDINTDAEEDGDINPETSPVRQYQSRMSNKRRPDEASGSLAIADAKKSRLQSSPISSVMRTPKRTDENLKLTFRDREHRQKLVLQPTNQLNHPEASTVLETSNSPLANVSRGSLLEDGEEEDIDKIQDMNVNDISAIAANSSINLDVDQEAELVVEKPSHSSLDVFAAMMDEQEEEGKEQYNLESELKDEDVSLIAHEEIEEIRKAYKISNDELTKVLESKNELLESRLNELTKADEKMRILELSYSTLLGEKDNIVAMNRVYAAEISALKEMLNKSKRETGFQSHKIGLKEVRLTKYRDMYRRLFSHAKANEEALHIKGSLLDKLKNQIQLLEDEKRDLISYREKIEKELESIKCDFSEQLHDLDEANEKLSTEIISKEALIEELDECNKRLSELSETLNNSQEECKSFEQKYNESSKNVVLLEEKVIELDNICKELSTELEALKTESNQLAEKSDDLASKLVIYEEEKQSLEQKLKESEGKAQLFLEDKEKLVSDFDAFQESIARDLKSKDEEITRLESSNADLTESYNTVIQSSDADQSSKVHAIEELKVKLKDTELTISKLEEALDEMRSSKTELQGYAEEKERQIAEKDSFIAQLERKIDELSSTESSDEKVKELTAALEEAQAAVDNHQANVEQRLNELAQDLYIQYSQKHEKKVEIIKKGYETKWSSKVKKLCKENELLNSEIADLKRKLKIESDEKQRLVKTFGDRQ